MYVFKSAKSLQIVFVS